jgi:ABC-type transport system involved in multi-copper enzyme maturation permease subunit
MPVHELVYKRMAERPSGKPRHQSWAMSSYGFRLAYRSKMAWFITIVAFIPAVLFSFILYLSQEAGGGMGQELARTLTAIKATDNDGWTNAVAPAVRFLFGLQAWFVTFLAAFKGAPLISEDVSRHALDLYFSRPLSWFAYGFGKWLTVFRGLILVQVLPLLLVSVTACAFLPNFLAQAWPLNLLMIVSGIVVAAAYSILAVGVSAMSRSPRFAVVAWFILSFFTTLAGTILSAATDTAEFAYVSFRHNVETVAAWIMGLPNAETDGAEDPRLALLALAVYLGVSVWALVRRLRRGILA